MSRILGQDRATRILSAAMRSGRMHHAWIFSGPNGVGKATCAQELAKLLLDPTTTEADVDAFAPERTSEVARLIDAGSHPDLHIITKELALFSDNAQLRSRKLSNIPIDLLRERMLGGKTGDDRVHEAAAYRTAVLGHGKVFIIDEAELLDENGQNAMLKTLEEPPAQTYLILVTSAPHRLLPTIRSRCQHVRFGLLDDESMNAWFEQSDLDVAGEERTWLQWYSEGSPGRAQLAAEYGFHEWHTHLAPSLAQLARGQFPVEMGTMMADLVNDYAEAWVKNHDNASKDAANKAGIRHLLTLLSAHVRREMHRALERGEDISTWTRTAELLRCTEGEIASNVNMKLVLENLAVQWLSREPVEI